MASVLDHVEDPSALLSLESIREELIRAEDTIVFNLHKRAQHPQNSAVYQQGKLTISRGDGDGSEMCLLEHVLTESEKLDGSMSKYRRIPDHLFFPLALHTHTKTYPSSPHLPEFAARVNVNNMIYDYYLHTLLPRLTKDADDGEYAATALADVHCLQAFSRRIHHGLYVAEAKFRGDPEIYTPLIRRRDSTGILTALTNVQVEECIFQRVWRKAAYYESASGKPGFADFVAETYRDWIIPLTKEVEVDVLLNRFIDKPNK